MLPAEAGDTCEGRTAADNATVRTVFIVGPDKKIKLMLVYPMSSGRELRRSPACARLAATDREAQRGHAGELEAGRRRDHSTSRLSDEQAKQKFPGGWKTLKPYLRVTAQPK